MRQFGSTQSVFSIEEYHQGHFYHEFGSEEELKVAYKSWENITMMERSPKGLGATEDYLKWRASRDQGHLTAKPTELEGSIPHRNILSEEANALLVDSLQKADTKNQQLQKRIRQLENQQQVLKREVKRLRREAMTKKAEFEEQEVQ